MEQMLFPKSEIVFPQGFAYENSKKVRKFFQKAQDFQSQLHLKGIAKTYIGSDASHNQMPCVLTDVLKHIEGMDKQTEEYETALQFLIMLSIKPSYLLDLAVESRKKQNEVSIKKFRKFRSKSFAIYRSLDTFIDSLRITLMYIERGTKDLDRDPTDSIKGRNTQYVLNKNSDVINELDLCFKAYYWELKRYIPNLESQPSVNERLLLHCLKKKWLLPISNVILIRDAQYQMMKKTKYKSEELLSRQAKPFFVGPPLAYENRVKCAQITYRYALQIKEILSGFVGKTGEGQSVQGEMIAHFRAKSKKAEQEQVNNLLGIPFLSHSYRDILWNLNHFAPSIFDVPIIDKTKLSLKLSDIFDLNSNQYFNLQNEIPVKLRERGQHFQIPKDGVSQEEKDDYKKIMTAFSAFIDPDIFLSKDEKTMEMTLKRLKDAASIIERHTRKPFESDAQFFKIPDQKNIEKVFDIIFKYVEFTDLTLPCLFLSNAIEIDYIDQFDFKGFPKKFTKCISNNLIKYQKKSHIGILSGVTHFNRNLLIQVANDKIFQQKMDSIKEVLYENDWQHFFQYVYPQMVKHPENNTFSLKIRDVVHDFDHNPAYRDHFIYSAYFQMMNNHLRELKMEVTKTVIGHYIEVARNDVKSLSSR